MLNTQEQASRYKLYKSGKQWIIAVTAVAVIGVAVSSQTAHAATASNDATANQTVTKQSASANQTLVLPAAKSTTTGNASLLYGQSPTDNQQTTATKSFSDDQELTNHFTKETSPHLVNQVLGQATIYHIFADETSISADVNGNIATGRLVTGPEFGTRGESQNHTTADVYYIGQINQIGANAFRTGNNYVVLGSKQGVKFNGNQVEINGARMDHLKKDDVQLAPGYIDFNAEFSKLKGNADLLAQVSTGKGVVIDLRDMNNRTIDVSKATGSVITVDIDVNLLEQPQPITIKGLSSKKAGPLIVMNVRNANGTVNFVTQTKLVYNDGTQVSPNESHAVPNHVLWNFGNQVRTVNINSGYLLGSVLAPNAELTASVNVDGNLVAHRVNISGGESHRWDLWAPKFIQPVIPHASFVEEPDEPVHQPGRLVTTKSREYQVSRVAKRR